LAFIGQPPDDPPGRRSRVDRVPTFGLIDPDDDQPARGARPSDRLVRLALGDVDLDTTWVGEDLADLVR